MNSATEGGGVSSTTSSGELSGYDDVPEFEDDVTPVEGQSTGSSRNDPDDDPWHNQSGADSVSGVTSESIHDYQSDPSSTETRSQAGSSLMDGASSPNSSSLMHGDSSPLYEEESDSQSADTSSVPTSQVLEIVPETEVHVHMEMEGTIQVPYEEGMTFSMLRQKLLNDHDKEVTQQHEFYDDYNEKIDENGIVEGGKRVMLKLPQYTITIQDCDWEQEMLLKSTDTIEKLKEEVKLKFGHPLEALSYNGEEIPDQREIRDLGAPALHRLTLQGMITVNIIDDACKINCMIHCPPFWDIEKLLVEYLEQSQRSRHPVYELKLRRDSEEKILKTETEKLHQVHIRHKSLLEYTVPPYQVKIFDHDVQQEFGETALGGTTEAHTMEVHDEWTVLNVMDEYARETGNFFNETDSLLMGTRKLDKNMHLFKLRFRTDEELAIQREEKAVEMIYVCFGCGFDVKLKREEPVQCHHCFQRILLKKRTRRVCQYNCR